MELNRAKKIVDSILETPNDPYQRMSFPEREPTKLDVRYIPAQDALYVPENKYGVNYVGEENLNLVNSHVRDCVVVNIYGLENGAYGMAHVNRDDGIKSSFGEIRSSTVEQMLDELPKDRYKTEIVTKGQPSETSYAAAKNSIIQSSNVEEDRFDVIIPDYPSELNPELKPFQNAIRNSIELGLSPEGEVFIPGNHPVKDYEDEKLKVSSRGPGISKEF